MSIAAGFMVPHPPLIIPAVGRGEEKLIAATTAAYEQAAREIADLRPETIVITSPHSVLYLDYFHISPGRGADGNFGHFRASQASYHADYDTEFVRELSQHCEQIGFPAGTLGERDASLDHATMIPLHFIQQQYTDFRVVRIGLSGEPLIRHYELGQLIRQTSDHLGRRTVLVASGDLSHKLKEDGPYGFSEDGPRYDARIMDVMSRGAFGELFDFDPAFCESAAECGHRSFVILAGAFDRQRVTARQLSYEDRTGVGYGICTFYPGEEDPDRDFGVRAAEKERQRHEEIREKEDPYVRLARASLEQYVRTGEAMSMPDILPKELRQRRAGAFVSLKKDGRLRGCIGTISPVRDNLAQEIMENAVSAGTGDPRFQPVRADELDDLVYSVDVLGEPEAIDGPEQLDVHRYGVIVRNGGRTGLLLPDLEGVDTVEEQIAIARRKAGIDPEEPVHLERFEVVRHR
ncbi:MAG: AmmeMemoRadiSam system protein A [Anaerovoracaceae bacterium]|jgi:AmmeMemoRadiSam system protein A/AmmeMemoRadiSam system protein B